MQKATSKKQAQPKSPAAGAKPEADPRRKETDCGSDTDTQRATGKPYTAQQTIPYMQMFPDGICHVSGKRYSQRP